MSIEPAAIACCSLAPPWKPIFSTSTPCFWKMPLATPTLVIVEHERRAVRRADADLVHRVARRGEAGGKPGNGEDRAGAAEGVLEGCTHGRLPVMVAVMIVRAHRAPRGAHSAAAAVSCRAAASAATIGRVMVKKLAPAPDDIVSSRAPGLTYM